jgi:hypothetical protein
MMDYEHKNGSSHPTIPTNRFPQSFGKLKIEIKSHQKINDNHIKIESPSIHKKNVLNDSITNQKFIMFRGASSRKFT